MPARDGGEWFNFIVNCRSPANRAPAAREERRDQIEDDVRDDRTPA
jgi:hypothetical protein